MKIDSCPQCGETRTVAGSTSPSEAQQFFRPFLRRNLRFWLCHFNIHTGVHLREPFRACLSCGLVWGRILPEDLQKFMARETIRLTGKRKAAQSEL
jgi:hypothetical protein